MHPTSSAKSPAMSSKDGLSCKAILRSNNGTMGLSSSSSSMVWHEGEVRKKEVSRTSKPKRTSFKCFQCNKTFPTQQAMAGHCSAHTRARSQKRAVARKNLALPRAIRYVPYARPTSNQVMVTVPYLDLHGHGTMTPVMMAPTTNPVLQPLSPSHSKPTSTLLGWRAFVPIYSMSSCRVNVAPPSDVVSSTNTTRHTQIDLTLQLSSGHKYTQRKALPLLRSLIMAPNRQQGANRGCQSVDGVDQGNMVGSQKDDLDLELHLFR
ncbi:uncharacterized protein LOC123410407 [Hordeum vulgare subsp. vulgare]|uniref:C2H2-type domain-containing protein n=1 Tax=Hordeum vulgare subsp. vulgare TaxID=112509 RepID=A0A8I6YE69_HORVV|nr:uncharacterized protein LOC123410407 [Hordeum vulgare subsp. vulgare]